MFWDQGVPSADRLDRAEAFQTPHRPKQGFADDIPGRHTLRAGISGRAAPSAPLADRPRAEARGPCFGRRSASRRRPRPTHKRHPRPPRRFRTRRSPTPGRRQLADLSRPGHLARWSRRSRWCARTQPRRRSRHPANRGFAVGRGSVGRGGCAGGSGPCLATTVSRSDPGTYSAASHGCSAWGLASSSRATRGLSIAAAAATSLLKRRTKSGRTDGCRISVAQRPHRCPSLSTSPHPRGRTDSLQAPSTTRRPGSNHRSLAR